MSFIWRNDADLIRPQSGVEELGDDLFDVLGLDAVEEGSA